VVRLALPSTSYRLPNFVNTAIRIGIKSYLYDSLRCSIHEKIRKTTCRICSLEIGVLIRQKFMRTNRTGLTDQHSLYQHLTLRRIFQCQSAVLRTAVSVSLWTCHRSRSKSLNTNPISVTPHH